LVIGAERADAMDVGFEEAAALRRAYRDAGSLIDNPDSPPPTTKR
jgi:hypothetical protein